MKKHLAYLAIMVLIGAVQIAKAQQTNCTSRDNGTTVTTNCTTGPTAYQQGYAAGQGLGALGIVAGHAISRSIRAHQEKALGKAQFNAMTPEGKQLAADAACADKKPGFKLHPLDGIHRSCYMGSDNRMHARVQ